MTSTSTLATAVLIATLTVATDGQSAYDTSDCALLLAPASPHTHHQSTGGHYGATACITFADVEAAFDYALKATGGIPAVQGPRYENADIAALATVVTEMTRFLANRYQLDKETISEGLSLIDTTRTRLHQYCPQFLVKYDCSDARYRTMSGFCNNMANPHWGAAMTAMSDFVTPDYSDGVSGLRASSALANAAAHPAHAHASASHNSVYGGSGYAPAPLPSPRLVSSVVHGDSGHHDHAVTMLLVAWGQFLDHDLVLAAETRDPYTGKAPDCCNAYSHKPPHPNCEPISIPDYDPFYGRFGQKCMSFARNLAALRSKCKLGPRRPLNTLSSYIDAGPIYSNTEDKMQTLRTYQHGKLKSLDAFTPTSHYPMKHLLPLKLEGPDEGCIRPSADVFCFLAGDGRVNEQTVLAVVHTLMMREHNRLCDGLRHVNPHWSDETLFHEARHIMAAIMQHITYNEFLPMVLGKQVMEAYDLVLAKSGTTSTYNERINPTIATSFSTAAFRFGHTLLPSTVERWSKTHRYISSQRLSEMLQQPYDLYKEGWMDTYTVGMANQVAQAFDDSVTQEVTNHLFRKPNKHFGMDLAAINIQRAREQGVPGYTVWRQFCHLTVPQTWYDLHGIMSNATVHAYSQIYASPADLDLWSAGISEIPLPGSMVGPTFACLIGKQFHNLRHGDRFWYETAGWKSSFTIEQLNEIRKVRLSRVICDNSDNIETIQSYAMVLPDHEINQRVACSNHYQLPPLDFSKWVDVKRATAYGPHGHGHQAGATSPAYTFPSAFFQK